MQKLNEELQRKEAKWAPTIAKLQEQVKFLEKENQLLHEDNHKLKLKTVSPKVSQTFSLLRNFLPCHVAQTFP